MISVAKRMARPATVSVCRSACLDRAAPPPLLEVVEEVDLVVLGGAEHRRGDQDRRHVERHPDQPHHQEHHQDREQRRDHRHQPRAAAAEHHQEGREDDDDGEREALHQRGDEALRHLGVQRAEADDLQLERGERGVLADRRFPVSADRRVEARERPLRPSARLITVRCDCASSWGCTKRWSIGSSESMPSRSAAICSRSSARLGPGVALAAQVADQAQDRGRTDGDAHLGIASRAPAGSGAGPVSTSGSEALPGPPVIQTSVIDSPGSSCSRRLTSR